MDKKCFAHDPKKGCRILKDTPSCGQSCPFRKSATEVKAGRQAAYRRLASLPEEYQRYIADTYYKGKRPWLKTNRKVVGV